MNEQGQIRHQTAQAAWSLSWGPGGVRIERRPLGSEREQTVELPPNALADFTAAVERLRSIPCGSLAWFERKLREFAEAVEAETPEAEPAPEPRETKPAKRRRGRV